MVKNDSALIIGAGIAGIKASIELAEMGHKVYLIDKNPTIGGKLTTLDKQYPTDNCTLCQMLPTFGCNTLNEECLRKELEHDNIEIITNAEVEKLSGKAKDFKVQLIKNIDFVDNDKCINCGYCEEICPVEVKCEYGVRKAVYVKSPLAYPNIYLIDEINCTKCGKCIKICPTKAIDFSKNEKKIELNVGAVIVALGFEEFDPSNLKQYNYSNNPNILSSLEFEKLYSGFGINKKELLRPSDNKKIEKIAILQCIGSRDTDRNYCSSACCMIALKEAIIVKESSPEIDVTIFYMDLRDYGKSYHKYYEKAKKLGINFINYRVPNIDITKNSDIILNYALKGEIKESIFDIAVLSNGFIAPKNNKKLSKILGIGLNEHGYFKTSDISGVESNKEGIFICGTAVEPKDITDTIIESTAASLKASVLLDRKIEKDVMKERELGDEELKIGIYISEFREAEKNKIDIQDLINYLNNFPNVSFIEKVEFLQISLDKINQKIKKMGTNRIIFVSFSPYLLENKFRKIQNEIDISPNLIKFLNVPFIINIDKKRNTEIVKREIELAYENLKFEENREVTKEKVLNKALVIGGGISGLTTALSIAEKGYEIDIIEKTNKLGGNLQSIFYTLDGVDTQKLLKDTIKNAEKNKLINIYKNTSLKEVNGYIGNFEIKIDINGEIKELKYGTIVIATGGKQKITDEYSMGKDKRIITQKEFEQMIVEKKIKAKSIAMIQCVGSREGENSYCSRICCSQALKNAIKLKKKNKDIEVFILNRDIMSYGFLEEYYKKASELGVNFIRYDLEKKPKVSINKNLKIEVNDSILNENIKFDADLLVLSTGIVPNDNLDLAETIGLPRDEFGFFKEANAKFRPLEFLKTGIFICGLAHSPRNLKETISQAHAAAGRAVTILSKENLQSRSAISEVNERWCVGCELCIEACPFDARILDNAKGVASTIDVLCQGCGVCAMICPGGVSKLKGAKDKQVFAMVDVGV